MFKTNIVNGEKKCNRCLEWLALSKFARHGKKQRIYHLCRPCSVERTTEWRRKYAEEYNAKARIYLRAYRAKAPQSARRAVKKWVAKNKEKTWAHDRVRYALKTGKLVKGSCEACDTERVDAHHDDYTKPLVVRWLCRKHHKDAHRKVDNLVA